MPNSRRSVGLQKRKSFGVRTIDFHGNINVSSVLRVEAHVPERHDTPKVGEMTLASRSRDTRMTNTMYKVLLRGSDHKFSGLGFSGVVQSRCRIRAAFLNTFFFFFFLKKEIWMSKTYRIYWESDTSQRRGKNEREGRMAKESIWCKEFMRRRRILFHSFKMQKQNKTVYITRCSHFTWYSNTHSLAWCLCVNIYKYIYFKRGIQRTHDLLYLSFIHNSWPHSLRREKSE